MIGKKNKAQQLLLQKQQKMFEIRCGFDSSCRQTAPQKLPVRKSLRGNKKRLINIFCSVQNFTFSSHLAPQILQKCNIRVASEICKELHTPKRFCGKVGQTTNKLKNGKFKHQQTQAKESSVQRLCIKHNQTDKEQTKKFGGCRFWGL